MHSTKLIEYLHPRRAIRYILIIVQLKGNTLLSTLQEKQEKNNIHLPSNKVRTTMMTPSDPPSSPGQVLHIELIVMNVDVGLGGFIARAIA